MMDICEEAVRLGEKMGADEVEAYGVTEKVREVAFKGKKLFSRASTTTGIGVRVAVGKKLGFSSTSLTIVRDVEEAVRRALAVARVAEPDRDWSSFPTICGKASIRKVYDKETGELEIDVLSSTAIDIINDVKCIDKKATVTRGFIAVGEEVVSISNSYNRSLNRKSTFASATVTVKAEESGKKGQSSESSQKRAWSDINFPEISGEASERAVQMMNAKPIKSGNLNVIWRNNVFADVLGIMLGGTLTADSVQDRRSPWIGKIGKKVAIEGFNILDDGVKEAGMRTREFDDEGYPQQKTPLIIRGELVNYLYDNYTAQKEEKKSTGNASRGYQTIPTPMANNLTLEGGGVKPDDLIRDVNQGLYVYEVIGEWLSNPLSGNLSATITNAYLVERGELSQAVKGVIVSADFFKIINDEEILIASDVENSGSNYSPTVKTPSINVIGR